MKSIADVSGQRHPILGNKKTDIGRLPPAYEKPFALKISNSPLRRSTAQNMQSNRGEYQGHIARNPTV